MIDGIKINCQIFNGLDWLDNKYLKFSTSVSLQTGEILSNKQIAKYKGLVFSITQSIKYKNKYYFEVRGSLHKYFNKGKHNANDFNFNDLQNVINELHQKFNINPETSIIHNLEFGVNINTPVPVNEVLKGLVSYKNYTFGKLKIEGVNVGKAIYQTKQKTKVYNKGKQYKMPTKNLLRFEIAINKMEQLPTKLKTLSDLQNIDKIKPLSVLLVNVWNDIIYYDKNINWKQLTEFERKKLLYYASPRNWNDFTKKQRYRAKQHFSSLISKFSNSTTHQEISQLIDTKTKELTANICPPLAHDFNQSTKDKMSTFGQLEYTRQTWTNTNTNNTLKFCPKIALKKPPFESNLKPQKNALKKCKVCLIDISHKKVNSKFCTKKCNNKYHGKKRTLKRQKRIATEKENLKMLLQILAKNKLLLLVTYKTDTGTYSDNLHQYEINTTPNWIKQIISVSITGHRKNGKQIFLTTVRAKQLIRNINKLNQL